MLAFILHLSCLSILILYCFCCNNYQQHFSFSDKHIAILILARGGSKGVKLKNLSLVNGKSLLRISLDEIKKVSGVNSVWVSTDHSKIIKEAESENVNIHVRSAESATDNASSIFAVQEFLSKHSQIDVVGLVQCTSPFLNAKYLQLAVNYMRSNEECVFSASRSFKLRWMLTNNNTIKPLNFNLKRRARRQDLSGEFVENGMFYFCNKKLIKEGMLQSSR